MGLDIKSTSAAATSATTNGARGSAATELFSLDKLSGGRSQTPPAANGAPASMPQEAAKGSSAAADGKSVSPPASAQSTPVKNPKAPADRTPAAAQTAAGAEPATPGGNAAASLAADTQIASACTRGLAKGRPSSRDVTAKTNAAADEPIKGPPVRSEGGGVDEHGLQLATLNQGVAAADPASTGSASADTAGPVTSDSAQPPAEDASAITSNPITVALASQVLVSHVLASQALAAAFGGPPAAQTPAPSDEPVADSLAGVAGPDSGGAPMKNLVALLAATAAGPKGKDPELASAAMADTATSSADSRSAGNDKSVAADPAAPLPNGAVSLAHLGFASHIVRNESTPTAELRSSVGTPAWNDELGNQLTWMSQQGVDSASLRLCPQHLGPVEVRISVQNGAASVWFGASQADTRAALERALPHLRQMFANQGLTLTDSGVSREPPRQSKATSSQAIATVAAVSGTEVTSPATRLSLALVDTYV